MGLILNIETATNICSVVLAKDSKVVAIRESGEDKSHASKLTLFIEEILKEQKLEISQLDAIAVSKGPGSYTGLRIGVSAAKGLCYGGDVKMISVNTLLSMATVAGIKLKNSSSETHLLCPMIDARRMEVYTAFYDQQLNEIVPTKAEIIEKGSFGSLLEQQAIYFFGNGAEKCMDLIAHPNSRFVKDIEASALGMVAHSEHALLNNSFENVAYFEPYYLKDFIATTPKKKLF